MFKPLTFTEVCQNIQPRDNYMKLLDAFTELTTLLNTDDYIPKCSFKLDKLSYIAYGQFLKGIFMKLSTATQFQNFIEEYNKCFGGKSDTIFMNRFNLYNNSFYEWVGIQYEKFEPPMSPVTEEYFDYIVIGLIPPAYFSNVRPFLSYILNLITTKSLGDRYIARALEYDLAHECMRSVPVAYVIATQS